MSDACTEASRQLIKEAGWGALARLAPKAVSWLAPKVLKWAPKLLGKTVGGWLGRAAPSMIGKAVTHGLYGAGIGGGIGAATAEPGSRFGGFLRGAGAGGLAGLGTGALTGASTHALAPKIYGQGAKMFGAGGKLLGKTGPMGARQAQAVAAAPYTGGLKHMRRFAGGASISTPVTGVGAKTLGGKAMSALPLAGTMMLGGGGGAPATAGAAPGAAAGAASSVAGPTAPFGRQLGGLHQRMQRPFVRYVGGWRKASKLGEFVKAAKMARVQALVIVLEKTAGQLPQFSPTPLSSHTAIADYIKNKKYKPETNEYTRDDQAFLNKLVAGMSKSRARAVSGHRRARNKPQQLLKHHFQAAGLWS